MKTVIPFKHHFSFEYGKIERLSPMIRRVVANNPSFFTFYGTNTYILGNGNVALVDPGPDLPEHFDAIVAGLEGEVITHILVTHPHLDHWPGYAALQKAYGAKTYGYIPGSRSNHNPAEEKGDAEDISNQERFENTGFTPDVGLGHGEVLEGDGWSVECVFTPGHSSTHMCFQLREEKALFSGDHVMAWSTSVISPPSGNMEDYMNSLELLQQRDDKQFWPAHGLGIDDPKNFVRLFIDHRREREQEILEQLKKGVDTIQKMVPYIYKDIPEFLHPAAERSTLAAVIYMEKRGAISCTDEATVSSKLILN